MKNIICPVAKRLKKARINKNISQKQLGILVGMDTKVASARMNQYERGKHVPDYATLLKIAKVVDVPLVYFYCADDLEASTLLSLYRLRPSQQEQISALIRRIDFS